MDHGTSANTASSSDLRAYAEAERCASRSPAPYDSFHRGRFGCERRSAALNFDQRFFFLRCRSPSVRFDGLRFLRPLRRKKKRRAKRGDTRTALSTFRAASFSDFLITSEIPSRSYRSNGEKETRHSKNLFGGGGKRGRAGGFFFSWSRACPAFCLSFSLSRALSLSLSLFFLFRRRDNSPLSQFLFPHPPHDPLENRQAAAREVEPDDGPADARRRRSRQQQRKRRRSRRRPFRHAASAGAAAFVRRRGAPALRRRARAPLGRPSSPRRHQHDLARHGGRRTVRFF